MRDIVRARALLGILLLVSLTLVLVDVRGSGAVAGLRGITAAVVGPIERAVTAATAPFTAAVRSMTTFGDQSDRTAAVTQDVQQLHDGSANQNQIASQANQLQSMLKLAGIGGYRVVPARVVGYGSFVTFTGSVTLDIGSRDGIEKDMSVITGDGLVGKTISVSPTTATVQLMTDSKVVVGARLEGNGQVGALQGAGKPNEAQLRMLDPTVDLSVGQKLVSFGSPDGRPYAPGLPLGTITALHGTAGQVDRSATVVPAANLNSLDIVGVVVVPVRTEARESVLPTPAPSSSGSASPTPSATEVTP